MVINRGYDRLVNLSDAVVAIAVTLLVLPLVDDAGNIGVDTPGKFLAEHSEQLMIFVLSFVVIARFWVGHHQLYRNIDGYTVPLIWINFLWLLSIVFLPFPTELLGQGVSGNATKDALYIGTMAVATYAGLAQRIVVIRTPDMQLENIRGTLRLAPAVLLAAAMTLALILTISVPDLGLWALLVLPLSAVVEHAWDRRTVPIKRRPTREGPTQST